MKLTDETKLFLEMPEYLFCSEIATHLQSVRDTLAVEFYRGNFHNVDELQVLTDIIGYLWARRDNTDE